jgi:hypothetical protein
MDDQNPDQARVTGKITDFGLSYTFNPSSVIDSGNSQVSDAFRWRAPELASLENDNVEMYNNYMEKADVWSFALTALEVSSSLRTGPS